MSVRVCFTCVSLLKTLWEKKKLLGEKGVGAVKSRDCMVNSRMALVGVLLTETNYTGSGESRARSDCTHVQADLALHNPLNKSIIPNGKIRAIKPFSSTGPVSVSTQSPELR